MFGFNLKKKQIMATICPICLDDINANTKNTETKCKHLFHQECLDKHKKIYTQCPMCRTQIHTRTWYVENKEEEHVVAFPNSRPNISQMDRATLNLYRSHNPNL